MVIIKRGETMSERFLREEHECPGCFTRFKVEEGDAFKELGGACVSHDCPVCSRTILWTDSRKQGTTVPSPFPVIPWYPAPYYPRPYNPWLSPVVIYTTTGTTSDPVSINTRVGVNPTWPVADVPTMALT